MKLPRLQLLLFFTIFLIINTAKSAPTSSDETKLATNPCSVEDLEACDENDIECDFKNTARRQKRQVICNDNPQCHFCNDSIPVEISGLNEDDIVVLPEIVPTLSPPVENVDLGIPINETIIIDADISSITESQPIDMRGGESRKLVERNIVIENDNETQYFRGYVDPSSNITTIIRLTNLINNTNVINMPTTLNNTNINNIHVYSNKTSNTGGKFGLGYTEEGPCCWTMKPGTCKRTTAGLKCNHKKGRVCGKQCNRKMIHPGRTMCSHIPQWPYMMCPPGQQPSYMPNPYYPPSFYPPPFEDPENEDDDELPLFPEEETLDDPDSGWIVMQEKCKIVSEDGLHISNCTENDVEFEHPFARNSIDNQGKRIARHAGKYPQSHQSPTQQQPYGYPMMQPVFIQPIPIYMPQYFMPQPGMNNYPQQLPFPPLESEQFYDEPVIESKNHNPYRKSRKHAKKHPIVYDHEEEL